MKPAWRWLIAFYANAGHLQHVYLNRKNNTGAYRAAINQLTRQFDRTFRSAPDLQATEDRNAVVAAVRGASTRAPVEPPVNLGRLSDNEFRREVRSKYGFDPGVWRFGSRIGRGPHPRRAA